MNEYKFINPDEERFFESEARINRSKQNLEEIFKTNIFELSNLDFQILLTDEVKNLDTKNTVRMNLLTISQNAEFLQRELTTDLASDPNNLNIKNRLNELILLQSKAKELFSQLNA